MNTFRLIAVSIAVLFFLMFFALPDPDINKNITPENLPWNITLHENGDTEIFGLRLGQSTLNDAAQRFHEPEDIALYIGKDKTSLEAYFGTVTIGPLQAKLILTLKTSHEDLEGMLERTRGRDMSSSEDMRIKLSGRDKFQAGERIIQGITFIPRYSGLGSDFFKQRLGEPDYWLRLNEHAVNYLYPGKGLSLTIDSEGKEILQYSRPEDFLIPEAAIAQSGKK